MSGKFLQMTEMICLVGTFGCVSAQSGLGGPPGSAGGSTDSGGGTAGQSATSTAGDTGEPLGTGGTNAGVGGAKATGGTPSALGGGAATGGVASTMPAGALVMTWKLGATSNDSSEVDVTLPTGAAIISASTVTITLCGQANVPMILATDITFDQAALICPPTPTPTDCQYGQNYGLKDAATAMTVSVTGTALSACYVLYLSKVNHSLAPGGMIKVVYRFNNDSSVVGLNYTHGPAWSALVDGQTSATCKLGDWPSTTATCQ